MGGIMLMGIALLMGIFGACGMVAAGLMIGLYGDGSFAKLWPLVAVSVAILFAAGALYGFGHSLHSKGK